METKLFVILNILVIILSLPVNKVEGGECCKAHYDLVHRYNDEKWCEKYCCYRLHNHDCCDDEHKRVHESDRESYCSDWFKSNVWATVLIAIASIGFVVACIVFCMWCYCRGRRTRGAVLIPNQPNNVVVMTQQRSSREDDGDDNNPYNTGYDQ